MARPNQGASANSTSAASVSWPVAMVLSATDRVSSGLCGRDIESVLVGSFVQNRSPGLVRDLKGTVES